MYGGSGISPSVSSTSSKTPSNEKRMMRLPSGVIFSTVASSGQRPRASASPNTIVAPFFSFFPGLTRHSQTQAPCPPEASAGVSALLPERFSNRTSTAAPVSGFFPYSLAGITFVSFKMRRSPARKKEVIS